MDFSNFDANAAIDSIMLDSVKCVMIATIELPDHSYEEVMSMLGEGIIPDCDETNPKTGKWPVSRRSPSNIPTPPTAASSVVAVARPLPAFPSAAATMLLTMLLNLLANKVRLQGQIISIAKKRLPDNEMKLLGKIQN
ncbi:uncharacterized protein [Leptinotarsa decemlineata]|uniref:uncharacterized protein n=1 Tax=Leptinotarsa decemlineata TaxID=7539 RepID=UPI003D306AF2